MQLLFNLLEAFRTFRDRHSSPQCVTFALWYLPMQDVWNCAWFYFLQKKVCAVVFPFQFLFNFYLKKVFDCNRLFFVGTNWIIDTFWWYCTLFWNTCVPFAWLRAGLSIYIVPSTIKYWTLQVWAWCDTTSMCTYLRIYVSQSRVWWISEILTWQKYLLVKSHLSFISWTDFSMTKSKLPVTNGEIKCRTR